jgi:hypothetical protein
MLFVYLHKQDAESASAFALKMEHIAVLWKLLFYAIQSNLEQGTVSSPQEIYLKLLMVEPYSMTMSWISHIKNEN